VSSGLPPRSARNRVYQWFSWRIIPQGSPMRIWTPGLDRAAQHIRHSHQPRRLLPDRHRVHNLKKWKFPSTNITANGYLVIYASGKRSASARLHTNFVARFGRRISGLCEARRSSIISEFPPPLRSNTRYYSYGFDTTGTNLVYFSTGRPGPRISAVWSLFAEEHQIQPGRGYYEAPF